MLLGSHDVRYIARVPLASQPARARVVMWGRARYDDRVMRRARLIPLVVLLLVVSSAAALAARAPAPPGADELLAHVVALTAPSMAGRESGTAGADLAGRYIADRLAAMGLRGGGDGGSFLQPFELSAGTAVGAESALERPGADPARLVVGRDWTPHGGSLTGDVTAELVFVGYGLTEGGRDDWAGVDVRDKIALALDGVPAALGRPRPARLQKLIAAREHGASALLIVGDPLPSLAASQASVRIVSGAVTRAGAARLLDGSPVAAARFQEALVATTAPASFPTGVMARVRVSLERETRRTANVIGILPGTDPARAGDVVVLGAHYDHLGRSGGVVYPGADDNASGTSVVLGLARAFADAGGAPPTLVFALFSGEEEGFLGSAHYVRHPPLPIERTVAMLNFDMVGRMRGQELHVGGVGSGTELRALVSEAAAGTVALVAQDSPFAPSDHTSFYSAGVPVLFFYTGGHEDYHTPRDTMDKINAPGMAEVARVALRVVERLAGAARPAYVKLSPPAREHRFTGAPGSAFLGVAVAPVGESDGVRLASVLPGTAAARAGLRRGDVIVSLGDRPVDSFGELQRILEQKQPGDAISLVYLRDGDDHRAEIRLGARH
jgi:aminopeptidase YwaD